MTTSGCGYLGLVDALNDCLSSYLERFTALMRRLEKRKATANYWSILQQSLTLNQTSGELLLQLEQLDITLAIDFLEHTKLFLASEGKHGKAVDQHHLFLLESQAIVKIEDFHNKVQQGTNYPVLSSSLKLVSKLCSELQAASFGIIFYTIQEQFDQVSANHELWNSSVAGGSEMAEPEMPDFSFTPQEYITQIGQYLMTLPQHLEPYMTNENPALSRALAVRSFGLLLDSMSRSKLFYRRECFLIAQG